MDGSPRVRVVVVAVSCGSCAGKPTWESAARLLAARLQNRFGDRLTVEYVELFSPRSFELSEVMAGIENETLKLPVVLVNDQVVSSGTKLNEGLVARRAAEILSA